MRSRTALTVVLAGALLLASPGCWDKKELNEMLHAVSVYLDLEGEMLRLTAEVLTVGSQSREGAPAEHTIVTALGTGLMDALANIRKSSEREISLSHVDYLVFGEELARAGLADVVKALSHDYEVRSHMYVAVTPGKAADLLSARLVSARHAELFFGLLETGARSGSAGGTNTLLDLQRTMANQPAIDALIPRLILLPPPPVKHAAQHAQAGGGGMEGGQEGAAESEPGMPTAAIGGAALFRGDRLLGFVEEYESVGLRWAVAPVSNQNIWVPVDGGGGFSMTVSRTRPRLTVEESQGRLQLRISVQVEADVTELAGSVEAGSPAALAQIETLTAQYIEAEIAAGVAYAEMLQADPLGVGLELSRWHPALWERLREDWPRPLESAAHLIEAEVHVITTGVLRRRLPVGRTQTGTGL